MSKTCPICGERLKNHRCELCGYVEREDHGFSPAEVPTCSTCGEPQETWSDVFPQPDKPREEPREETREKAESPHVHTFETFTSQKSDGKKKHSAGFVIGLLVVLMFLFPFLMIILSVLGQIFPILPVVLGIVIVVLVVKKIKKK